MSEQLLPCPRCGAEAFMMVMVSADNERDAVKAWN